MLYSSGYEKTFQDLQFSFLNFFVQFVKPSYSSFVKVTVITIVIWRMRNYIIFQNSIVIAYLIFQIKELKRKTKNKSKKYMNNIVFDFFRFYKKMSN